MGLRGLVAGLIPYFCQGHFANFTSFLNLPIVKLAPIILAAGLSRRMGEKNKLFLPFLGKTLLEATLENILAAEVGETVVVLGHEAVRVEDLLKNKPVQMVENPLYEMGMTTSIQAGVLAALDGVAGYMICLADMPLISPAEYKLLADAFFQQLKMDEKAIVQPIYQGQRGNPVIFSGQYKAAILRLKYMEGCKPIVQENRAHLIQIEMPGDAVLRDADDEAAYQKLFK